MLTPDQIKPFLSHPDRFVRCAVANYFQESWSRDPDILPTLLRLAEQNGEEVERSSFLRCDHLAITDEAADLTLDFLARARNTTIKEALGRTIVEAPVAWQVRRQEAIRANPNFNRERLPRLERRREWASWSGGRLWEELQELSRRSQDQRTTGEIDLRVSTDLVELLADHDVPDAETILRLLASKDIEGQWLEIWLTDLVGLRRLSAAIPIVIEKLHIDTDYLCERAVVALVRINDPEASRLIGEQYPTAGDGFQIYTSGALEDLKYPLSEEVLLQLVKLENLTFETNLYEGLCKLFSEQGVELVRQKIAHGYDRMTTRLESDLLPVLDILGIDVPEAAAGRAERELHDRRMWQRLDQWDKEGVLKALLSTKATKPPPAPLPPPPRRTDYRSAVPFLHGKVRVGRNDPCPCKSGKKFKQCCGKKT